MKNLEEITEAYDWLNTTRYGNGFHAKKYLPFLKCLRVGSVLDIGTGRGQFCDWAKNNLCDIVYGLDISLDPLPEFEKKGINFIKGVSHDIPLPDKSVDMTTSFDFLEHIHPDFLEKTILEIKRVTKKCMFHRVQSGPSSMHKDKLGELHLIQKHRKDYWVRQVFEPIGELTSLIHGGIFTVLE